ncbi:hypothetical protein ABMX64_20035 [Vibrio vulnificus]|uniref:hypothetical protein n=1 Tax=Vibrio vulnificus TaxID=672 RepID=UPI0040597416
MTETEILARHERTQAMHLKRMIVGLEERDIFGFSAIQRVCKIGYNNACHIAERGVREGLLRAESDHQFRLTEKGKALSEKLKAQ